jgi:ABC-2 type transport system permease protein
MMAMFTRTAKYRPPLRAYRSLAAISLKNAIAYRLQFFVSSLGTIFMLVSMLYLWHAILSNSPNSGFTWPQMKAYLVIGFIANTLVSSSTDYGMAMRILDGMVAIDLSRPITYQNARFAEAAGAALFEWLSSALIVVALAPLFGGFALPDGAHLLLFIVSMVLVLPLKFAIVYCTALLTFWTHNYIGVTWARTAVISLMSGAIIPLQFFPGWLQSIAEVLPFQGIAYTPAMIFIEKFSVMESLKGVAVQLAWALALWLLAAAAWRAAYRRLTVHGG